MGTFFSETGWLCLTVTAVLGAVILCKLKKNHRQEGRKMVCLAGLWGGACLLSLSLFWGLILFSLSCFLMYAYFSGQEFLPVDQKAVLITGGDSGIGHALSKYLDKLGFTVFAGVLDEKGSGAEELRRTCSKHLSVLQLDITNSQQIRDAHSKVMEKVQNRGLWAVVNNAGILGFPIDGELIPMTQYKRCMAVNFFGAVEVTKAFLPLLRKSKGRLVNISSMAGGVPMEKMAAYSSTKAALTMFSAVMRKELSKWGVKVSVIQPGSFQTNGAEPSEEDQREDGMVCSFNIEGQVSGSAVHSCSPASFQQGIKLGSDVSVKHHLLLSEGYDPSPSSPLLSSSLTSRVWADADDPCGSVLSSGTLNN
uniref:Estradiol 17-beta-dehydrogenase 2 n=1 Tax=Sus scrofa TaxID=9823 RepID=A0A8D0JWI5_PIG